MEAKLCGNTDEEPNKEPPAVSLCGNRIGCTKPPFNDATGSTVDELKISQPNGTWSTASHLYNELSPTPFSDLAKNERATTLAEFTPTSQAKYNCKGSCSCQGEREVQKDTAKEPASDLKLWADG